MQHRMKEYYSKTKNYYILNLENGSAIDSGLRGSAARFANHSCSPNSEMQKWYVNGVPRIGLFARDSIPAGTELTYDYNFDWFEGATMQVCHCGEPNCRGFIGRRSRKPENQRQSSKDIAKPATATEVAKNKTPTIPERSVRKKSPLKPITIRAKVAKSTPATKSKVYDDVVTLKRSSRKSADPTSQPSKLNELSPKKSRKPIILLDDEEEAEENEPQIVPDPQLTQDKPENRESPAAEPELTVEVTPTMEDIKPISESTLPSSNTHVSTESHVSSAAPTPRRRGRPKGSKSMKPKPLVDLQSLLSARITRSASVSVSHDSPAITTPRKLRNRIVLSSSPSHVSPSEKVKDIRSSVTKMPNTSRKSSVSTPPPLNSEDIEEVSIINDNEPLPISIEKPEQTESFPTSQGYDSDSNYLTSPEGTPPVEKSSEDSKLESKILTETSPIPGKPKDPQSSNVILMSDDVLIDSQTITPSPRTESNEQLKPIYEPVEETSVSKGQTPSETAQSQDEPVEEVIQKENIVAVSTKEPTSNSRKRGPRTKRLKGKVAKTSLGTVAKPSGLKRGRKKSTHNSQSSVETQSISQKASDTPLGTSQLPVILNKTSEELNTASQPSKPSPVNNVELPEMAAEPKLIRLDPPLFGTSYQQQTTRSKEHSILPYSLSKQPESRAQSNKDQHVLLSPNQAPSSSPLKKNGPASVENSFVSPTRVPGEQIPSYQPGSFQSNQYSRNSQYSPSISTPQPNSQDGSTYYYSADRRSPSSPTSVHGNTETPQQNVPSGPFPSLTAALPSHVHYTSPYPPSQTLIPPHPGYLPSRTQQFALVPIPNSSVPYPSAGYQGVHAISVNSNAQSPPPLSTPLPSIHTEPLLPSDFRIVSHVPPLQYGQSIHTSSATNIPSMYDRRRFSLPGRSQVLPDPGMPPLVRELVSPSTPHPINSSSLNDNTAKQRRHSGYQTAVDDHASYAEIQHTSARNLSTDPQNYQLQQRQSTTNTSWRQQVSIQSLVTSPSPEISQNDKESGKTNNPEIISKSHNNVLEENSLNNISPERNPSISNSISALVHSPTVLPTYSTDATSSTPSKPLAEKDSIVSSTSNVPGTPTSHGTQTNSKASDSAPRSFTSVNGPNGLSAVSQENKSDGTPGRKIMVIAPKAPSGSPVEKPVLRTERISASKTSLLAKPRRGRPPNSTRMSLPSPQPIAPLASSLPHTPLTPDPASILLSNLAASNLAATNLAASNLAAANLAASSPSDDNPRKKGRPVKGSLPTVIKPRRGRPPNSGPAQRPFLAPLALRPPSSQGLMPTNSSSDNSASPKITIAPKPSPNGRGDTPVSTMQKGVEMLPTATPSSTKSVKLLKKRARPHSDEPSSIAAKKPRTLPTILPNGIISPSNYSHFVPTSASNSLGVSTPVSDLGDSTSPNETMSPSTSRTSISPRLTVTNAIKAAIGSNRSLLSKAPKPVDSSGSPSSSGEKRGRGRPRTRPKDYWTYNNRKARGEFGPGSNYGKGTSSSPFASPSSNQGTTGGVSKPNTPVAIRPASGKLQVE